jgi:hypothetical protein
MSPNLFNENIKIEIIVTDTETNNSITAETSTKILKELYDKHHIWGMDILFSQLYKELTNKNGE